MADMYALVFVPVAAQEIARDGFFSAPKEFVGAPEVVGMLSGPIGCGKADEDTVRAELTALGASLDFVALASSDRPGYIEAHIAYRVLVPDFATARGIPGFISFYYAAGPSYVPLADVDEMTKNRISGQSDFEQFGMPEGTPLPEYTPDGAAVFSMKPYGQSWRAVFLREKPDSWFKVSGDISEDGAAELVRRQIEP